MIVETNTRTASAHRDSAHSSEKIWDLATQPGDSFDYEAVKQKMNEAACDILLCIQERSNDIGTLARKVGSLSDYIGRPPSTGTG